VSEGRGGLVERYWYAGRLVQGDRLSLSIEDPGLLYGATVFTTLRVYAASLAHPLTCWAAHSDRLRQSVVALGWDEPDWERVQAGALALSAHDSVLRVTLFPDGREWILGRSLPASLPQWQQQGITAWLAAPAQDYGRSLPQFKTGNYLAPWQARRQAQQHQAQEAILVNSLGHWLETSTGNLWGWGQGAWWTPPLTAGVLPGVARSHLITGLKCQNESIYEIPWSPEVIASLEAIAYSNAVVELVPIHTVLEGGKVQSFDAQHPVFERLRCHFRQGIAPDF
jgi:branched-subunit amino acid aminotransferase/4-amino-4-deoxychorismate lyase